MAGETWISSTSWSLSCATKLSKARTPSDEMERTPPRWTTTLPGTSLAGTLSNFSSILPAIVKWRLPSPSFFLSTVTILRSDIEVHRRAALLSRAVRPGDMQDRRDFGEPTRRDAEDQLVGDRVGHHQAQPGAGHSRRRLGDALGHLLEPLGDRHLGQRPEGIGHRGHQRLPVAAVAQRHRLVGTERHRETA